ncbi:glycoside hydrolase family 5 protein [Boletus edulis BED1]|uniref:mannan endo-1,4-beta-mannosidase n=1 Tax=Boletus edulis BED1 TaxID=1328754 RepID=A0AAD4C3U7_BOLED|nr:glycoside hydrolase family 5 protein [Boletus edulis BED1]
MNLLSFLFLLSPLVVLAAVPHPSRTTVRRNHSPFIGTDGTSFVLNGSNFRYIGTNAYWLPALNTNEDIWYTLGNISALGIKVVRLWAFNDVNTVPINGTWFQLVSNGTVSINDGPNGLQKLDTIVDMAEKHGLYVILSLTNNWYPLPLLPINDTGIVPRDVTPGTNNSLPRNYLSNDYGGMDLYVREFGLETHDQFYTDPSILNAFLNFTTQIVSRYVNSPAILSWEPANDPRCNSTLLASKSCTTETVTKWHATVATHIRSIDPNHLISAGTSGFLCTGCPKLYPLHPNPPPAPSASPVPGKRKRSKAVPVTTEQILRERAESRRRNREAATMTGTLKEDGIRIRGRWMSTATRRQETQSVGPTYDGSYGVDSQDILNIPNIGFGSFMLFPDQQSYGPTDPNLDPYTNTLNLGTDWIVKQTQSANAVGKPLALTSFGLVTQGNAQNFVPFNMTTAPFAPDASSNINSTYGVTNQQQTEAYSTWFNTGITSGLGGIVEYQWGQSNLTAETGTTISPGVTGISHDAQTTPVSPNNDTTGISPNDGYSNIGNDGVQQVVQNATQNIAAN